MKNRHILSTFKKLALGFFFVQGVCFFAFAQSLDSIQNLSSVTISAASRPRTSPTIGQLQSLNISSLQRLNAIQLSDAVKYFAGATVKDYGGIGGLKTVSVRSLGASHTGVFIDKIPTNNAMNGQIDLGKFTLDNVSEIRLSNDNFSSDLQTASYYSKSSQLTLFSVRPTFDENQNTQAEVLLKIGSFGLFNPQFNIYQKFKKQLFSLNADYQKAKGNYPFKLINGQITTLETRSNSAVESYRMDFNWQNLLASNHQYFVKANYYYNHRQLPGYVTFYNHPSNQELWDDEKSLQGQYNYLFSDSTKILFNAKISETFNHFINHDYLGSLPQDNQFTQTEYFGSAASQSRYIKGFQASLSSDIIFHKMRSNLWQYAYPTRLTSLTNFALNYRLPSVFFYGNLLQTATFEQAKSTDVATNRHRFSPTLGVNFQNKKIPQFSTRFFYKETYRIPTFNELYYTNIGNTNLSPEAAKQLNLGVSTGKSVAEKMYFFVSVDGYLNKVSEKIVAIPTNNLFTWSMRNIGKVNILGLDAILKTGFEVNEKLDFYSELCYSFQDAKDVSSARLPSYNQQIPYTPKHSGSVIFGMNTILTLQYGLIFSGERYMLGVNSANNRLTPYFDHSISISKHFSIQKTNWRMAFEILNFTNKNYEIVAYYPMPGRQYRMTAKMKM
ncbi:MAG: TonB-dependent receptor plug domain-containing protein [Bacteroidales bacterium]|nr:TonB-dependent receptor plug domain-containing protein [Bacteroidales bacterium]